MTYYSKIDWWLAALFLGVLLLQIFLGFRGLAAGKNSGWIPILTAIFMMITISLTLPCRYTMHDDHLQIQSGIFVNVSIKYADIVKINKTNNPLTAPALSLARIQISSKHGGALISPKNRDEFIEKLNSHINEKRS